MIDQITKERILDAARIEEVVGDFVSLRRKGANYWGICPFHQDKNPSMSVSPTRGIFKCFSCGKAGNAVTFVMEHEHLSYWEALKYLAEKYHIEIKEKEETPEEIASRLKHESLLVVTEFAGKFFQDVLWNDDSGRTVGLSYFRERKFTDETIRKFALGYAPLHNPSLCKEAITKGFKKEYLIESGLAVERENGDIVDRFYDRVIFPIHSISGRTIGFGGRTLRTDKSVAKYVNSPQSEIYDKSHTLYGIFQAKGAIGRSDKCILVEGYADVISMHQSGIENVVASSGTSLTEGQIRLIKRFTSNITLLYDGDQAGIKAALRGTDLILHEGMHVKVVLLPPEDDPDSYAKAHTQAEILEYIERHECDFITFKSDLAERESTNDPIRRANLITDIIRSIAVIPDPILRSIYTAEVASRFAQKEENILQKVAELREKILAEDRLKSRQQGTALQGAAYQSPIQQDEVQPLQGPSLQAPVQDVLSRESYLAVQEREITYYLLKFGCYPIPGLGMTVQDYVSRTLSDDSLEFKNLTYKKLYEEYYSFASQFPGDGEVPDPAEAKERQAKVAEHFMRDIDPSLLEASLDILIEDDQLTVKLYRESLEPEEQRLNYLVPKSIGLYKLRIIEQMCSDLTARINEAQHSGEEKLQKELVSQLQVLSKAKLAINKELETL